MQNNNFNQSNIQEEVEYSFVIDRYEVFTSRSNQQYLKLVFQLWNENEEFEKDQLYQLDGNGGIHPSFYEFVNQFSKFGEVIEEFGIEDLIGERGTCHIKSNFSKGRIYHKISLTSWEDDSNE